MICMCRNDGTEIDMSEYEIVKRGISIIVYVQCFVLNKTMVWLRLVSVWFVFIFQESIKPTQDVQTVGRHWLHPAVLHSRIREKVHRCALIFVQVISCDLQMLDVLSDFVEEDSDQQAVEKPAPLSYKR